MQAHDLTPEGDVTATRSAVVASSQSSRRVEDVNGLGRAKESRNGFGVLSTSVSPALRDPHRRRSGQRGGAQKERAGERRKKRVGMTVARVISISGKRVWDTSGSHSRFVPGTRPPALARASRARGPLTTSSGCVDRRASSEKAGSRARGSLWRASRAPRAPLPRNRRCGHRGDATRLLGGEDQPQPSTNWNTM